MSDKLSPAQRRKCMQANKSKGTSIEKILGSALWDKGFRYRKHCKKVVGHPDFCFRKKKIAVFCDGEFWHGRNWEEKRADIHSNCDFWREKIEKNIARDYAVTEQLQCEGWTVLRFWETDIRRHLDDCVAIIEEALNGADFPSEYNCENDEATDWLTAAEDEAEYGKKE